METSLEYPWFIDLSNYTINQSYLDYEEDYVMEHGSGTPALACLATWIIIINGFMLMATVAPQKLRYILSNWLIMNMFTVDMLFGIIILPFSVYHHMHPSWWQFSRHMCTAWILLDVLFHCVNLFTIIMLNIDTLLFVLQPALYEKRMTRPLMALMVASSWLIPFILSTSFYFSGSDPSSVPEGQCFVILSSAATLGTTITTFFLPTCFATSTNFSIILVIIVKILKKGSCDVEQDVRRELAVAKLGQVAFTVTLVTGLFIAMWLPFYLLQMANSAGHHDIVSPVVLTASLWLGYANSGITPLLWLIYPGIRQGCTYVLCCGRTKESEGVYLDDVAVQPGPPTIEESKDAPYRGSGVYDEPAVFVLQNR